MLDLRRGSIASATPVSDDLALVTTLDEPPVAVFSGWMDRSSRLTAWSPVDARFLWEQAVDSGSMSRETIFPTVPGRLAMSTVQTIDSRKRAERLLPVDAARGVLPPPAGPEVGATATRLSGAW